MQTENLSREEFEKQQNNFATKINKNRQILREFEAKWAAKTTKPKPDLAWCARTL